MITNYIFHDRADAGRELAKELPESIKKQNPMILALPRGGVPIAAEIALAWGLPFDVLIVRKIGIPGHDEVAMGAIAGDGIKVLDHDLISHLKLNEDQVEAVIRRESAELQRREKLYREGKPRQDFNDRNVILVDDGIATGSTMLAAINLLRAQGARRIIVATPVAALNAAMLLRAKADDVFTVIEPKYFKAVGQWYEDFSEINDEQVKCLLGA